MIYMRSRRELLGYAYNLDEICVGLVAIMCGSRSILRAGT